MMNLSERERDRSVLLGGVAVTHRTIRSVIVRRGVSAEKRELMVLSIELLDG
jgi:hypothetical protein